MLSPSSSEGTILVVEDQPGLCALTEEVLTSAGYSILVAQDGANALRVAQEYSGHIQLLLTDLVLPQVGGKEIAARLHALRPEMKVLFMSGHARGAMTENGTLDRDANFIEKPWSPRALCEEIHAVLTSQPSTLRILVVDDEAGIRDWLAEVLAACGHRVFTAKDGVEAKQLARRQPLDLMITDISMPNEDGIGIVCALRKAHPDLKIIAISGSNADALMDAKLLGASATLTKPFTSEMVLNCIRGLLPVVT
jgi:DNA-binding response OmpR family regulator